MTDKELLGLAAKAWIHSNGYDAKAWFENWQTAPFDPRYCPDEWFYWNPLDDDSDALRLAVKLRININFEEWDGVEYACAVPRKSHQGQDEVLDDDENAATRRAVVRAAAEIGKAMKSKVKHQVA